MSIKQIHIAQGPATLSTGLDTFVLLDNGTTASVTEADKAQYLRVGGSTFDHLSVRISANTLNINSNVNFRKNSAAGNQTAVITASTTGLFQDTSNTDTLATNDTVDLEYKVGVATGSATIDFASAVSSPSSNFRILNKRVNNLSGASFYLGLTSDTVSPTENLVSNKIRTSGVLKKGQAYISTNTAASNNTVATRINGANGNIAVVVTALTTGLFEDTTNTDTIASGDVVNWLAQNIAGSTVCPLLGVNFVADDASINEVLAGLNVSVAAGATTYFVISGKSTVNATELNVEAPIDFNYTVSKADIFVSANATTSNSSVDFRVGAASPSGVPTITITSGTTGLFSDSSSSYTGSSGDLVNYRIVNGGGGSLTLRGYSILMNETQSAPPTGRTSRLSMMGVS